jgi:hypothetical protein
MDGRLRWTLLVGIFLRSTKESVFAGKNDLKRVKVYSEMRDMKRGEDSEGYKQKAGSNKAAGLARAVFSEASSTATSLTKDAPVLWSH